MANTESVVLPPGTRILDLSDKAKDARGRDKSRPKLTVSDGRGGVSVTPGMLAKMKRYGVEFDEGGGKTTRVAGRADAQR